MKILVIGSGGREHALCWKLAQEHEVFCTPGNPGIEQCAECFSVKATDLAGIAALADRLQPDLVVVGPEDPLIAGLADRLRSAGHAVFGPGADGAKLEGSKAYSKDVMRAAGIPTAAFGTFTDAEAALAYATSRFAEGTGVAVKASGAALGKGVVVCATLDEAEDAIAMMLVEGELGEAGATIVIEDRLIGFEFSLLTLVSGTQYQSLPIAQDYKRALDGDRGPNTGGMGSYSPVPHVSDALVKRAESEIVAPVLHHLATQGIDYRGVLFTGVMVQDDTPYCLEFNVRFGDPETQTIMRRIGAGLGEALLACANGTSIPAVPVLPNHVVTVVLASQGYPGPIKRGQPIEIRELAGDVVVFHAGTATDAGQLVTAGGRVLGVSAAANSLTEASTAAYHGVAQISAPSLRCRTDIASGIA